MLKICFPSSDFELMSLNLRLFIIILCLSFVLNGLFYTDAQLSSRYQQGELTFWQDMLRSFEQVAIVFSLTLTRSLCSLCISTNFLSLNRIIHIFHNFLLRLTHHPVISQNHKLLLFSAV